jgi:F-type H+-transporting ATPase subunit delta
MSANNGADLKATVDVGAQRVAQVYAEALLNAAEKKGQSNEIVTDLETLVGDVFRAEPQFEAFLSSGAIGRDRKAPVIGSVFGQRAGELFTNFLLVLNDHERLDLLRPILAAARDLANERANRIRVYVRSAIPLSDEQRGRLQEQLRKSFRKEPVLDSAIDPELLGGLVVQVGDWQYDASVRTQLETLRNQLIERSSYEIQSRRDRFCSPNGN